MRNWESSKYGYQAAPARALRLYIDARLQVDIFYIHMPDGKTPISETLAGVDEVYKLGLFRRFGLSNYQADDVQAVYDHCAEKGYVLPSVYQGSYSPITRYQETELFPTLRKLGIAFYAYSPSASGFLGKTVAQGRRKCAKPACRPSFPSKVRREPGVQGGARKVGGHRGSRGSWPR